MKTSGKLPSNGGQSPTWLEAIKAAPPLLLTLLSLIVAYEIGPDMWRFFKEGAITKIGIGVVSLELAQKRLKEVTGLDQAGISPAVQLRLKRRFANIADYASEVRVLWVDDQHPQQNVRERRVLSALSVSVDLAVSTEEALKWLARADYDILITDLTRDNDSASPCTDVPGAPARAGCDLIKRVRLLQKSKPPTIIVYANKTEGIVRPANDLLVTDNAGNFFNAFIDTAERLDRPQ